jgi:PKD domain
VGALPNNYGTIVGERIPYTSVLSFGITWPSSLTDTGSVRSGLRGDVSAAAVSSAFQKYLAKPANFGFDVSYYQTEGPGSDDVSSIATLENAPQHVLPVLHPGDSFIVYITTHGGYDQGGTTAPIAVQVNPKDLTDTVVIAAKQYLMVGGGLHVDSKQLADIFKDPRWDGIYKLFIVDSCFAQGLWSDGNGGGLATLPRTALVASSSAGSFSWYNALTGQTCLSTAISQALGFLSSTTPPDGLSLDLLKDQINYFGRGVVQAMVTAGQVGLIEGPEDLWNLEGTPQWTDVVSYATSDFSLAPGPAPTATNGAVVANAGVDQTVHVGTLVILDGTGSNDPSGQVPLTYAWSFTSKPVGSTVTLSNPSSVNPSFTPDVVGDYHIQLVVTNIAGRASPPAIVTVSTANSPPVADAGPDQAVTVIGTSVPLDGSHSYDPDGQPITYQWSILSKPPGSNASLSGPTSAKPSFVADVHGDYSIQLIVIDSLGAASKPATIKVSFNNIAPVASAGLSRSVDVRQTVSLNGTGSSDANGDSLTYKWSLTSLPSGSTAVISNPTAPNASFVPDVPGTFVVQLTVNDGTVNSLPATAEIMAVTQPTSLTQQIRTVQGVVTNLPKSAFRNVLLKNALLIEFNAVLYSVNGHNYKGALLLLQGLVLPQIDG